MLNYGLTCSSFLTLVLARVGMVTIPFQDFPCRPKTKTNKTKQKQKNLIYLGDLCDILRGHFDEKEWGTTLPGDRVSCQRPVEWGGCHLRKFKTANSKNVITCMVLKLTVYVKNVISFFYKLKRGEIPIFGKFLANFSILAYVLQKIRYFEVRPCLWRYCDVIRWILYLLEETTHSYTIVPTRSIGFQVHMGVVTTPLGKPCYRKSLGKTRKIKCLFVC